MPAERSRGEAFAERLVPPHGFTLLGQPTISALVRAKGAAPLLAGRLWDVGPDRKQMLVGRGVYRLTPNQTGAITFQLRGNGYQFQPGHTVRLELAPADAPPFPANHAPFRTSASK